MFQKPRTTKDPSLLAAVRKRPCIVCRKPGPSTVSHILTRGSGHGDDPWNIVPMCWNPCHAKYGSVGAFKFCMDHPFFLAHLQSMGWFFLDKKLRHPNYRG